MKVDYDRISTLLGIVERAAGHSGKLNAISNAAMSELLQVNEDIRSEAIAAETKRREAEAAKAPPPEAPKAELRAEPNARPAVHPGDSQTATLADRRL